MASKPNLSPLRGFAEALAQGRWGDAAGELVTLHEQSHEAEKATVERAKDARPVEVIEVREVTEGKGCDRTVRTSDGPMRCARHDGGECVYEKASK